MKRIEIPELSLIALVGASSSGKSTFAKKYFKATEVLSSDFFRGMLSDDENDQSVSAEAFGLLYYAAGKRLGLGHRTVIDATNVRAEDRKHIIRLAKEQDVLAVAVVLNVSEKVLMERTEQRTDREISKKTVLSQHTAVQKSLGRLRKEGFRYVYVLEEEEIGELEISYTKLYCDKREQKGPFDIIGDVHGCYVELTELLEKLGYQREEGKGFVHPEGRTAVFVGDLTDRGPENVKTLRLVMDMVHAGSAMCVMGNHDEKLLRFLKGRKVEQKHGLAETVQELSKESVAFKKETREFLDGLISHFVLDDGKLVVSHAGIKESYIGRASGRVREFCLYGDVTGELDADGLPVRLHWEDEYRGKAMVVYGHTESGGVREKNNTFCIDTGCAFGGALTCLRYPERECVSVPAKEKYCDPLRPLRKEKKETGAFLKAEDVLGKLHIRTELLPSVTIGEERTAQAFEVMSRFAADPRWLIYLPPTMSPCETSTVDGYLEHPVEAFRYFEKNGVETVVCERKHMGSRCVIVLCKDAGAAERKFGVADGSKGIIYTRTGRKFFEEGDTEEILLERLCSVLTERGFWQEFHTDWVCLDAELMPWSKKAGLLLQTQYGPVGTAGHQGISAALDAVARAEVLFSREPRGASGQTSKQTGNRALSLETLRERLQKRLSAVNAYTEAYRNYCFPVKEVSDYRIAPFHILAAEGEVFFDKTHLWHMEQIRKYMVGVDPVFVATDYMTVHPGNEASKAEGMEWWKELTENGGEGMVVKPLDYVSRRGKNLLQPAVKCRGREYLRIIYGPEYLFPEHLELLKKRSLSVKRNLALKEFALGMESLERFVKGEPLYRYHECVFGVLALESEPVDARL